MMITKPGIYDDLPFVDYLKIPAMNFHTLKELDISALHLKHTIDGFRRPQTDALRLGRAYHCAILTPRLFDKEFHVSPGCGAVLKSGPRKGQACGSSASKSEDGIVFYCGTHAKGDDSLRDFDNVLSIEEGDNVERVRKAVIEHEASEALRDSRGMPEQTIIFERCGVLCKARIDWLLPGEFTDLKKSQADKLDDRNLLRTVVKYDYYQQLAFYSAAVFSIQGTLPEPSLLFVEDSAPYDVTLLPFDEQSVLIGLAEIDHLLIRYKRHLADNHWPGVYASAVSFETGKVKRGGLPKWKRDEAVMAGLVDEDSWPTEPLRGIDQLPALIGFDE